ncbi:hypothetical protein ETP43_00395 [Blautia faecicola]|uniref:Uncharacterized protein n=1 Tax=Blautia faecicola TaxID=2509240 RepID=A0A4Q1RLA3_9FIRM|nr:hypothetical protein ETP43_00395 [Blautia faecicola]
MLRQRGRQPVFRHDQRRQPHRPDDLYRDGDRIERSVCLKSCFGQADFAVVLCPCFKSPNDDNGYDISDYRDYIRSCSLWFLFRGRMCIIENGK